MSTAHLPAIAEKITSRGYWRVVIRPSRFREDRVPYEDLKRIVDRNSVRFRAWGYPQVKDPEDLLREGDSIGQETDKDQFIEFWRFFQSGQLYHVFAIDWDWWDQSEHRPSDWDWEPGTALGLESTVWSFTEIVEFAARLSQSEAGDDSMHIEIKLGGLSGRGLVGSRGSRYLTTAPSAMGEYSRSIDIPRADLIADAKGLALREVGEFFKRFGWDPPMPLLREIQSNPWGQGQRI